MAAPKISDADFIRLFDEIGPTKLSKQIDSPLAGVQRRRRNLEIKHGVVMTAPGAKVSNERFAAQHIAGRLNMALHNGVALVFSDMHAWPGKPSTAFRALIKFIKEMQPKAVIANGDLIDGSSISRHPPLGWDRLPTLIEEIEAAQDLLHQIEVAAPRKAELIWPCGNHDARFSKRLADRAPEFARVHGTQLKDHFGERWKPCWSVWLNDGDVVVKHRHRGGVHGGYNSTLHAGVTTVTGDTHVLEVKPLTDYKGRRYAIKTGMLAEPYHEAFSYMEDNPRNWTSGFAILTFKDGELLMPELCAVSSPGVVEFRGERRTV